MKLRTPKKREAARCDVSDEDVYKYFDNLDSVLTDVGVKNIPGGIWNLDETAISCDHGVVKILTNKDPTKTKKLS